VVRTPLILLNAVVFALLVGASCLVDRKTADFACSSDADCTGFTDQRVCDSTIGYCTALECPRVCNGGCNPTTKTCNVQCASAGQCVGAIDCPNGYACTINCLANNACSSIDCGDADSCVVNCMATNACGGIDCGLDDTPCQITCLGTNACDDIECSDGSCMVTCSGNNACGPVDCAGSCACMATCSTGSCGAVSCPTGCENASGGCMTTGAGCSTCS